MVECRRRKTTRILKDALILAAEEAGACPRSSTAKRAAIEVIDDPEGMRLPYDDAALAEQDHSRIETGESRDYQRGGLIQIPSR
jgi:hypothetical protein